MNTCSYNKLKLLLSLLLLFVYSGLSSQEISKPRLDFTFACASGSFNGFNLEFDFTGSPGPNGSPFNDGNVFIMELSDANGDFSSPIDVGRITGQNLTYVNVRGTIAFPSNIYGTNYRIRIVSTSPRIESPPSDVFEAYFLTPQQLILNNNENVSLCGNGDEEISLNDIGDGFLYKWYRNGNIISGQTGTSLSVSQPGEYYAAVNYGACGDAVASNKVIVSVFPQVDVSIQGPNEVEICSNETYDLVASIDDATYIYEWYKDDELITGLPNYQPTYTTPNADQFGVYRVEIKSANGCKSVSENVTISQKTPVEFTINSVGATTRVILPAETIELSVETEGVTSPTYQWYKDDIPLAARRQPTMNATDPGVYYLEVTDNSTACPTTRKSPEYTILGVNSLEPIVRADNYEECNSTETKLTLVGVKANATDDNQYDLSDEQLSMLAFQWFKDDAAITDANDRFIDVASYTDNGEYYINGKVNNLSGDSEKINILLTLDVEVESSSPSNKLCEGGTIVLTIENVAGFTYTWFKDGAELSVTDASRVEVTEVGEYYVVVQGFGCTKELPKIEVEEFDDSVVEVSPSTTAVLLPGETTTLTATGADSYEWYNSDGDLLSSNETLEVTRLGEYSLVASVAECSVTKKINVVPDDGNFIIPNILTPFTRDGVNDTWELPNKFAFQSEVQVLIYDSRGKEVLNTKDYQNDWPQDNNLKDGMLFYFKVIKQDTLIKAGTISVLR